MRHVFQIATIAGLTALAAPTLSEARDLNVVASFSIIADMARNVGGDDVIVTSLVGPDGDAHAFEAKPADARAIAAADVILINGLRFEGFITRLIEAGGAKGEVVAVSDGIEPLVLEDHDHAEGDHPHDHAGAAHDDAQGNAHGNVDPHAFQSVSNAKTYVENIAKTFCAADVERCASFRANAAVYAAKLDALETEIRAVVAAIPADKRTVITSHDAFGYFGKAYGLTFLAPEGISTDSEASAADVAALIRQVREDSASALFVENVTNPRLIEQIGTETGLKVGGTLYSDALSEEGGPAATYIDMMRHNAETIRGAILGS